MTASTWARGLFASFLPALTVAVAAASDRHATVAFSGNADADLYTKEVAASLDGVLRYNYVAKDGQYPLGFVRASPVPQSWYKTFWTRDGGVFLRELAHWGYWNEADSVSECLIKLVGKNAEGYYAFPRYFDSRIPKSGTELDGTSAVIIGMAALHAYLPVGDPERGAIYRFLHDPNSPVRYIEHELKASPLLTGEGEFGGGMGVKGPWCNVVQNQLAVLALEAAARLEASQGDTAAATEARDAAAALEASLRSHLVGPDNCWRWCVDPKTLKPDERVLHTATNEGFGGINGVLSMTADVQGLDPAKTSPKTFAVSRATFLKLYHTPLRQKEFDRYGIWTQFDRLGAGLLASPSYGMGYATQDMLLFDDLDGAAKALAFTAEATYQPLASYNLKRVSPYYFYERMYSPDAAGKVDLAAGCGALNLVNVAEPLKVARMIIGIDDSDPDCLQLFPRLPTGWTAFHALGWPVDARLGTTRIDIDYSVREGKAELSLKSDAKLPRIRVRLPTRNGWEIRSFENRDSLTATAKID